MNFGISIETDLEADNKSLLIQWVSDSLEGFLKDKSYGEGIQNYQIGFICSRPIPGFEAFSKIRKPKYMEVQKVKLLDGSTKEIEKAYSYDVELDLASYQAFVAASEKDALVIIYTSLVASLSNLDTLPKKVRDFDVSKFKSDLISYLARLKSNDRIMK